MNRCNKSLQSSKGFWGIRAIQVESLTPVKFLFSGGAATAVHYLAMASLLLCNISPLMATAIGSVLGAIINYWLQYHWAFQSQRQHRHSVPAFMAVSASSCVFNLLLFYLFNTLLFIPPLPAQLVTTGVLTVLNYFFYRRVVFL